MERNAGVKTVVILFFSLLFLAMLSSYSCKNLISEALGFYYNITSYYCCLNCIAIDYPDIILVICLLKKGQHTSVDMWTGHETRKKTKKSFKIQTDIQRAVRLGNRLAMLTALLIFNPSHKLIFKRWIIGAFSDIGWEEIPIVWGSYGTDRPSTFTSSLPLAPLRRICVLCSLSGNILIWSLCFYKTGQDLFGPWVICVSTCSQITVKMQENCCQIMHWRFLSGRLYIWCQGFDPNWNCLLGAVCFLFWSIKNSCTMSWNKIHVGHNAFNPFHVHSSPFVFFVLVSSCGARK